MCIVIVTVNYEKLHFKFEDDMSATRFVDTVLYNSYPVNGQDIRVTMRKG